MRLDGRRGAGWCQRGLGLVEAALVLVLIGVLGAAALRYVPATQAEANRNNSPLEAATLRQALMEHIRRNAALPCPDLSGDGRSGNASGDCPAGRVVGFYPHETLGLPRPREPVYYLVWRQVAGIDLTESVERSGDVAGAQGYRGLHDLIAGLRAAAAQPPNSQRPYLTGDNAGLGAEDCDNNRVSSPAFALVFPLRDADGDGEALDGVHRRWATGDYCLASASRVPDAQFDDRVISVSFSALAGQLMVAGL